MQVFFIRKQNLSSITRTVTSGFLKALFSFLKEKKKDIFYTEITFTGTSFSESCEYCLAFGRKYDGQLRSYVNQGVSMKGYIKIFLIKDSRPCLRYVVYPGENLSLEMFVQRIKITFIKVFGNLGPFPIQSEILHPQNSKDMVFLQNILEAPVYDGQNKTIMDQTKDYLDGKRSVSLCGCFKAQKLEKYISQEMEY